MSLINTTIKPFSADAYRAGKFITVTDAALASDISDANQRENRAWSLYCQTLFMANEFIYLR